MARGDAVVEIGAHSSDGDTVAIQPASGVEWVIKCFGGNNDTNLILEFYDGTYTVNVMRGDDGEKLGGRVTMAINNSHYARIRSSSDGARNWSYGGYITKE